MHLNKFVRCAAFLLPIALWSQTSTNAPVKVDPVLDADIRKLMEVAGLKQLFAQQMSQMSNMMTQLLRSNKSIPPQAIDEFNKRFQKDFTVEAVINMAVPIYAKNFTDSEIKQVIAYQMSPIGRKVSSAMPNVMKEMTEKGQERGSELGRQIMMDLSKEHPEWFKNGGGTTPK